MHDMYDHLDAILALGPGETYKLEGYVWKGDDEGLIELWDPDGGFVTAFMADEMFVEMNWPFEG